MKIVRIFLFHKYLIDKKVKSESKKYEEEGGIWKLKKAIENKWGDMKFDIIVGNPPYGMGRSEIHLNIFKTVLDFCNKKLCFIMPSKPIVQQLKPKWYDVFKNAVCTDVEVVDKSAFKETNMDNTVIFYCDKKANPEDYCKMLDVEDSMPYLFDNEGHRLFVEKMGIKCKEKHLKYRFFINGYYDDCFNEISRGVQNDKWYLNVNIANGSMGAKWFSGDVLKQGIKDSYEEVKYCEDNHKVKAIIECPSIEYGENLRSLMIDGKVLRYSLWLRQISQNMNDEVYTFVPDIDYTNIHNDSELLAACGFNEDEIVKLMKYLNDFDFSQNRNDIVRGTEANPEEPSPSTSDSLPKTIYGLKPEKLDPSSDIPEDEKYDEEDLKKAYPDQYETF